MTCRLPALSGQMRLGGWCSLPRRQRPHRRGPLEQPQQHAHRPAALRRRACGSRCSSTAASRCAMCSRSSCSTGSASRKPGSPDCLVPSRSPPPRSRKSSSAIRKPSSVSRSSVRRRRAASFTQSSCSSRQKLASAPRPTRPRNWCSCARPKRSACSITITLACRHVDADLDHRRRDQQPDAAGGERGQRAVAHRRVLLAMRQPHRRRRTARAASANRSSAAARSSASLSATSGQTQ